MKNFSAIPIFIAVVEYGSFSRAGEKLNKSKSAVSKRISQLEKDLGVRLLNRTTRCLSLTEAGEHYLYFARKALESACEGEDGVTQFQNNPKGLLRISIPMSFGRLHLAPLIIEFLDCYPEIEMDVVMDDRIVDLVEGRFDLAIRAGNLQDSTLVTRRLAICRSVLCASPAYIKKWGLPATPTDLIHHNCLLYSHHRGSEWTFHGPEGEIKVLLKGNLKVNNSEVLRAALLADQGIARIPSFIVGADIGAGHLVPLLEEYHLRVEKFYVVYPVRKYIPAKVKVFLDFIIKRLEGETPYWDDE